MKVVMLGATRGMGREVARLFAERGEDLFILGIPKEDLEATARDLEVRGGTGRKVGTAECDILAFDRIPAVLDAAEQALGGIDCVVVSAGAFGTQEELERDTARLTLVLQTNFTGTVLFCEEARKRLLARGGGTLCVFSSVAGDRGRKPVALYGCTKAGISHYLESLDHKYRAAGLVTVCVKPGFVKTSMTTGLKPPPFAATPEQAARDVVRAIDRKWPVVYTTWIWAWVMWVIRNLPRFVMRRINF